MGEGDSNMRQDGGRVQEIKAKIKQVWQVKIPRMDSWHNLRTKRENNKRERLRWCQVNKKIEADEINSMTAHLANLQMEPGVSN
jgi:hypothetical protein